MAHSGHTPTTLAGIPCYSRCRLILTAKSTRKYKCDPTYYENWKRGNDKYKAIMKKLGC